MSLYQILCDDCKAVIGETDSLRESASGGTCEPCKLTRQLQLVPFRAAMAAYEAGTSCIPAPHGCLHRDCAAARVERARALRRALATEAAL